MSDRDGAFKKAVGISTAVGAVYAVWILLGIGGERATQIFDDLYAVVVAMSAGVVTWRFTRDLPSRDGWRLISLSVLSWGAGEAIWSYYEIPLHMDVPFPSVADVGYLVSVPLAASGLFRLAGPMRSWAGQLKIALDGLTIGGSLLGLSWTLVLGGMYADTTASTFEKVIGLGYPLGDVVLITASILLFLRADTGQKTSLALLSLGFVATAFSDTAFALMTLRDDYGAGDIVGIGWLFSFLLIALAAVRASDPNATGAEVLSRKKAFLPYVPMALLLASIVAGQVKGEMTDPVPFWSLVAVISAVTARQLLAIMENVALNKSLESQVVARTAELSAREERFRALVTNSSDVVAVLDRSLKVTYVTAASNPVLGLDAEVLHLLPLLDLVHPNDRHRVTGAIGEALSEGGIPVAVDGKIQHGNGGWRYAQMMVTSLLDDPAVQGIVVNIRDMTDRKELEDQLREMALHDPLTGLPNRVLFADRVEHAVSRTPREGGSHAVVLIDLDGFKQINDGLGHAAGDQVLREVGRRFGSVVRAPDTLARLGGDEFALLVEQVHPSKAEEIFHRLDSVLSRPIMIEGRETYVTMSAGIAIAAGEQVDELLRNADVAMYTAKSKGTGGFEVYQAAMHERVMRRLEIEAELRKAIMSDSLQIHYQPVVSTGDHEMRAVEALVRWNHPVEGIVSPVEFIGFAEETGLVIPLGRWMLRNACQQIQGLRVRTGKPLRVAVNISVKHLADERIMQDIRDALSESGLEPEALTIEITESALMLPTSQVLGVLEAISDLGVKISIDDFGTGYSSLGYLGKFPVHAVKIDRSFVSNMEGGIEDSAVVRAVISLAKSFALETVAEGVEEHAQARHLAELGCHFMQGYLFGKPMPLEDLLGRLEPAEHTESAYAS